MLLLLIALLLPMQVRRIPGPGGSGTVGGGGSGFTDTFSGTTIDLSKWTVRQAGSGTVTQSNDLTVHGDGVWGHAYVESVQTFARAAGPITIDVNLTSNNCDNGRGTIGWGDSGDFDAAGNRSDVYMPFGTAFQLFNYHVGAGTDPQFNQLNFACTAGVPYRVVIVVKAAGGADIKFNGGAADPKSITVDPYEPTLPAGRVFLTALTGDAVFHSITVSQ